MAQPERSAVGKMPEASPASRRKVTPGVIQSLAEDKAKELPGCAHSPEAELERHDALQSLGCTQWRRGEEGQASELSAAAENVSPRRGRPVILLSLR